MTDIRMTVYTPKFLNSHQNTLMNSLIRPLSIGCRILAWSPGNVTGETINAGVCIDISLGSPRDGHLIGTECLATVFEISNIKFERRVVRKLLNHPRKSDIREPMRRVSSTDRLMTTREPTLLQMSSRIIWCNFPDRWCERCPSLIQCQSILSPISQKRTLEKQIQHWDEDLYPQTDNSHQLRSKSR
jgi:hypothetical protein